MVLASFLGEDPEVRRLFEKEVEKYEDRLQRTN